MHTLESKALCSIHSYIPTCVVANVVPWTKLHDTPHTSIASAEKTARQVNNSNTAEIRTCTVMIVGKALSRPQIAQSTQFLAVGDNVHGTLRA